MTEYVLEKEHFQVTNCSSAELYREIMSWISDIQVEEGDKGSDRGRESTGWRQKECVLNGGQGQRFKGQGA